MRRQRIGQTIILLDITEPARRAFTAGAWVITNELRGLRRPALLPLGAGVAVTIVAWLASPDAGWVTGQVIHSIDVRPPIGAGMPTGQRQTTLHLPGDATDVGADAALGLAAVLGYGSARG